jgi:hypothetical protein
MRLEKRGGKTAQVDQLSWRVSAVDLALEGAKEGVGPGQAAVPQSIMAAISGEGTDMPTTFIGGAIPGLSDDESGLAAYVGWHGDKAAGALEYFQVVANEPELYARGSLKWNLVDGGGQYTDYGVQGAYGPGARPGERGFHGTWQSGVMYRHASSETRLYLGAGMGYGTSDYGVGVGVRALSSPDSYEMTVSYRWRLGQ